MPSLLKSPTASERGIYVANCPGKNASAVAELTFTLIGCLDRRVPDGVASLRAGFTREEAESIARRAGLSYAAYTENFLAQRFAIAGLKPQGVPS